LIVGIFAFLLGLPGFLSGMFIQDSIDYVQDREDERQLMHELDEDMRMDRYLDKLDELKETKHSKSDIYIDNRQVHFHDHSKVDKKTKPKNKKIKD